MIAALVPAAGRSQRMGRPKLVLPIGGRSVIARLVASFRDGGADCVVVVAPPRNEPGALVLAAEAADAGAIVLHCPALTSEMRATVEIGLDDLARREPSTLLLAPGDSPGITPELVARVVRAARDDPTRIIVPRFNERRGHPIAIPWELARLIPELPPDVGVNALLRAHADRVAILEVDEPGAIDDLDTPEDYRRWSAGPTP